MRRLSIYGGFLCALAVLAPFRPAQASTIVYIVDVDTTSVSGTSGFLDFQLNPGNGTSQALTAQLANFISVAAACLVCRRSAGTFGHSFGTVRKQGRGLSALSTALACRNKQVRIAQRREKRSLVVSKCRPVLRAGSIEVEFLDHCSRTLDRQDGTINFHARPFSKPTNPLFNRSDGSRYVERVPCEQSRPKPIDQTVGVRWPPRTMEPGVTDCLPVRSGQSYRFGHLNGGFMERRPDVLRKGHSSKPRNAARRKKLSLKRVGRFAPRRCPKHDIFQGRNMYIPSGGAPRSTAGVADLDLDRVWSPMGPLKGVA